MAYQSLVGAVARRLPRGRARVARWLQRHPGSRPLEYADVNGHQRTADLSDEMECQCFAGANAGLPAAILARVAAGDWVIDAGASIGALTGQMAKRVGPRGHVWAIEPVPRNSERLAELTSKNGLSIRQFDVALGAEDGKVVLRIPPAGGSGWASVTASWIDAGEITVPVRSLDSLIAEHGAPATRLALIKIDVEGFESQVLAGATETLARFRPLLYVEFNDVILRDAGKSSMELLSEFGAVGYHPANGYDLAATRDHLRMRAVDLLLGPPPDSLELD